MDTIAMPPDVWGPIFWDAMHIVSLAYPAKPTAADKAGAKAFFEGLATVLPCPTCREHYKEKLAATPIDPALNSKGELIVWVWELHNQVNLMLKKPTVTMDEFLARMKRLGHQKQNRWASIAIAGVTGLVVGSATLYAYHKLTKKV